MKTNVILTVVLLLCSFIQASSQNAKEIIKKADELFQGERSSKSQMTLKIVRPTYERSLSFTNWTLERDYALTLVNSPAREKGQTFLKRKNELWSWNPTISRMIKLPPSMMSQGWMGSDYTNDDALKESSIVVDYDAKMIGSEKIDNYDCYKIELIPYEDAAVVWGKIIIWVAKEKYFQLKAEYYDEDDYLIRTMIAKNIKKMDDREIPTYIELLPEEEGNKTIMIINDIKFNIPINNDFFSQQNMKKVR